MASLRVILAWGNHGTWRQQDIYTLELLKNYTHLYSLGITKKGCPRHPLYLRSIIIILNLPKRLTTSVSILFVK